MHARIYESDGFVAFDVVSRVYRENAQDISLSMYTSVGSSFALPGLYYGEQIERSGKADSVEHANMLIDKTHPNITRLVIPKQFQ